MVTFCYLLKQFSQIIAFGLRVRQPLNVSRYFQQKRRREIDWSETVATQAIQMADANYASALNSLSKVTGPINNESLAQIGQLVKKTVQRRKAHEQTRT